jgi:hypothetical protein
MPAHERRSSVTPLSGARLRVERVEPVRAASTAEEPWGAKLPLTTTRGFPGSPATIPAVLEADGAHAACLV